MSFITQTSNGSAAPRGAVSSFFSEITSVPNSVTTDIFTYTIGAGKVFYLQQIECSGDNIAKYEVIINSEVAAVRRTEFTNLNDMFDFTGGASSGIPLSVGDEITLRVTHYRTSLGTFEGRLQLISF